MSEKSRLAGTAGLLPPAIRDLAVAERSFLMRRLRGHGITRFEAVVLRQIAASTEQDHDCTHAALATACKVEKPAITRAVDRLVELGLARRVRARSDGRVWLVRLTRRGERLLPPLVEIWRELSELLVAGLDADQAQLVHSWLTDARERIEALG